VQSASRPCPEDLEGRPFLIESDLALPRFHEKAVLVNPKLGGRRR
jgi:hypothetical protein